MCCGNHPLLTCVPVHWARTHLVIVGCFGDIARPCRCWQPLSTHKHIKCLFVLQGSRSKALQNFSRFRAPDARALVQISHTADQGFLSFVVPIILDRFFFGLAPWLFQTSSLRLLQLPGWRYSTVQCKKRIDRLLQIAIIGTVVSVLTYCVSWLACFLFRFVVRWCQC
jgi:hypothetical protein